MYPPPQEDSGFPTDIIHLIWFGDHIPWHYEQHVFRWVENNPQHTIWVHVGLNKLAIQALNQRFAPLVMTGRLKFFDFLDILATMNTELATTDEERVLVKTAQNYLLDEITLPNGSLAAASDILRILLLYFFGGWYVDFDLAPDLKRYAADRFVVNSKKHWCFYFERTYSFLPLGNDYKLKFGFQLRKDPYKKSACNDFLVSKPRSLLVKKILQRIIKNYQGIGTKFSTANFFIYRAEHIKHWILHLTGPNALVEALGDKGNGDLMVTDPEYLINSQILANIKLNSDHTWLPDGRLNIKIKELQMRVAAYKVQRLFRIKLKTPI